MRRRLIAGVLAVLGVLGVTAAVAGTGTFYHGHPVHAVADEMHYHG